MKVKKIFIILLISIIILLFFNSSTFASVLYLEDVENLLSEEYPYYVVFRDPQTDVNYMIISSVTTIVWGNIDLVFDAYSTSNCKFYEYNGTAWILIDSIPKCAWRLTSRQFNVKYYTAYGVYPIECMKHSNYDIYWHENDGGGIFFQQTLLPALEMKVEAVKEIPSMVMGLMKVMIPVCLTILSVVLLISLIKSVILRMV